MEGKNVNHFPFLSYNKKRSIDLLSGSGEGGYSLIMVRVT